MSQHDEKDSTRRPGEPRSHHDDRPSDRSDSPAKDDRLAHPNAFASHFFEVLRQRPDAPATPEADFAGPWRVLRLWGDGPPLWACYGCGERGPRLTYDERDLAYLGAAGLALAERRPRFRFQTGADGRRHLMHDGYPVATVAASVPDGCSLPTDLTRLADLRVQPQAFAHFLLSVPDEVLERAGTLAMELLRGERR